MSAYYNTSELTKLVGVSKNTVIRWEEKGVIPKALRDGRGWRVWPKEAIEKIIEIKKTKDLKKHDCLDNKKDNIYIIGYGNQAKVWAKNLKNSGAKVFIILRDQSKSIPQAISDGFEVKSVKDGLIEGKVFCVLIPDEKHKSFFEAFKNYIKSSSLFIFAHGYSVSYENLTFNARKALLAPKSIAKVLRKRFLDEKNTFAAYCIENKEDEKTIKDIAKMMFFNPLYETSFYNETISDLFTEQTILCGGVPYLILKAFNILKENNVPTELAIQECLYELSYILDIIKEKGMKGLYDLVSPVARSGGAKVLNKIRESESLNKIMEETFMEIKDKKFLSYFKNFNKDEFLNDIKNISKDFDITLKNYQEGGHE
jgi:ketol-acid reductoisomerase